MKYQLGDEVWIRGKIEALELFRGKLQYRVGVNTEEHILNLVTVREEEIYGTRPVEPAQIHAANGH